MQGSLTLLCHVQPWQVPKSRTYTPEEWEAKLGEGQEGGRAPSQPQGQGIVEVKTELFPVKQEDGEVVKARERKSLTLKERLEVCQATERQRLTFCKVYLSIHWRPAKCQCRRPRGRLRLTNLLDDYERGSRAYLI
jgi:hypothetical protein